MNSHTAADFLAAVRGISTNHVAQALTSLTPGITWNGSTKASMAKNYENSAPGNSRYGYTQLINLDLAKLAKRARARADGVRRWWDDAETDAWYAATAKGKAEQRVRDAAPELLAALRELRDATLPGAPMDLLWMGKAHAAANAAIAKATGNK